MTSWYFPWVQNPSNHHKRYDLPNCFTLRTVPDTFRIKEYIQNNNPKSAVVVGGGYIGIEMAENLKEAGLDVILIELSDHLLPPGL